MTDPTTMTDGELAVTRTLLVSPAKYSEMLEISKCDSKFEAAMFSSVVVRPSETLKHDQWVALNRKGRVIASSGFKRDNTAPGTVPDASAPDA